MGRFNRAAGRYRPVVVVLFPCKQQLESEFYTEQRRPCTESFHFHPPLPRSRWRARYSLSESAAPLDEDEDMIYQKMGKSFQSHNWHRFLSLLFCFNLTSISSSFLFIELPHHRSRSCFGNWNVCTHTLFIPTSFD